MLQSFSMLAVLALLESHTKKRESKYSGCDMLAVLLAGWVKGPQCSQATTSRQAPTCTAAPCSGQSPHPA